MTIWDDIDGCERNLANSLRIHKDYATSLLIAYNWNHDMIVSEWNREGSLVKNSVSEQCTFLHSTTTCVKCLQKLDCKSYGCAHLACANCVKTEVEREISNANIFPICLDPSCQKTMCASVFLNDICRMSRNEYKFGKLYSFRTYHTQPLNIPPHASQPSPQLSPVTTPHTTQHKDDFWLMLVILILAFAVLVLSVFCMVQRSDSIGYSRPNRHFVFGNFG